MKILFVQPTGDKRGHYGIYSANLCQELARLGNEVTLFTNKINTENILDETPSFSIVEWRAGRFAFQSQDEKKVRWPLYYIYGYLRNSFVIVGAALKFAKKGSFDVIQITDTEYGTLSLVLRLFGRRLPPVVLFVQASNFSFSKYSGNFVLKVYKVFQRFILKRRLGREIQSIVTLGEYHKKELQQQFRLSASFPIEVIHDGSNKPKQRLSKNDARKRLNISFSGRLFLFFGMLRRDKGIEYLLEAFSLISSEDVCLVIAGSLFDYSEESIAVLLEKFGIRDKTLLRLGYVEDRQVPLYFYAADAAVFPYRKIYTGGSGPLLKEAAVFETPVIVTDVSEMGRLVKERNMGLVAEAENPHSLATQMEFFLQMPASEIQKFTKNAAQAANSWTSMAEAYQSLYRGILNGKVYAPSSR